MVEQKVVDDEELAVDRDREAVGDDRAVDAEPPLPIGREELPAPARAEAVHGQVLQPVLRRLRGDDDDLRRSFSGQPSGERASDAFVRQILVLDEDQVPRLGDEAPVEALGLADLRFSFPGRPGAHDPDLDALDRGVDGRGPGIAPGGHRLDGLARSPFPAPARVLAERPCGIAADNELKVVERREGFALRRHPPGIVRPVLAGVPAARPRVEAADEGHLVVDDHDLFVQGGAVRVVAAEREVEMLGAHPAQLGPGQQLAVERVDHGVVPAVDPDVELRALLDELRQEGRELRRPAVLIAVAEHLQAAVDDPGQDQDRPPGPAQGIAQGDEVVRPVDDEGEPVGGRDSPDRVALDQDRASITHAAFSHGGGAGRRLGCLSW